MSTNNILTLAASTTPLNKFIIGEVLATANAGNAPDKRWLSDNYALDISIPAPPDVKGMVARLRKICDPHKIDIFITPAQNRRKNLLIADMDSTIVEGETLDDLSALVGLKDQVAAITARAMNGELNFHTALEERIALLKDLPRQAIDDTIETLRLNEGAESLLATMKNHGAKCYLVSSGFTHFTSAIANKLGFDAHHGNVFEFAGDVLSGKVVYPIQDKSTKVEMVETYTQKHTIPVSHTMTIGDGANDIPMLKMAEEVQGLGMGYHAKDVVAAQLINTIRFGHLKTALYAQGYRDNEIIS